MNSEQNKGYLMVLAAGALWGTIGFFATLLSNLGLGAAPVAFFRVLSASVVLAVILLVKGRGISLFKISKRGVFSCMLVGFVSQALYNVCYMNTIEQGGMATAAVIGLAAFGQGLNLMKVIGIALVLCSIAVMNMVKKTA